LWQSEICHPDRLTNLGILEVLLKIRKAVIPAAGHGSRMLPATKALPKELMIQSQAVYACAIEGEWHTVGDLLSYLKTSVAFSLNHPAIAKDFRKYLKELAPQLEEDPSSEKKPL
jgi:UTP-glucose-1-phosphate uridylyltransferase